MMALHQRQRTGLGQFIELAIAEATLCQLADAVMDYTMNGTVQAAVGNRAPGYAPCGCYPCKGEDAWVNITVTSDEEWQGLCRALGNPKWCSEQRFADAASRYRNQDELDELIAQWTRQLDHYEVMRLLQTDGVPVGPVLDEDEMVADPHIRERGFFEKLSQEDSGTHMYPGLLWKMSYTPNRIRRPPVRLGEDNEYVYKQIMGVSDDEYEALQREGHVGMDYLPHVP
jgi:crotonobetainyl-CoA:carnitine CoA-transferase CaiB-like acyl-CoA transferase